MPRLSRSSAKIFTVEFGKNPKYVVRPNDQRPWRLAYRHPGENWPGQNIHSDNAHVYCDAGSSPVVSSCGIACVWNLSSSYSACARKVIPNLMCDSRSVMPRLARRRKTAHALHHAVDPNPVHWPALRSCACDRPARWRPVVCSGRDHGGIEPRRSMQIWPRVRHTISRLCRRWSGREGIQGFVSSGLENENVCWEHYSEGRVSDSFY